MPNARPPTEKAAAERLPVHRYRRVVLAVGLLASVSTAWLVWRSPVLADPKVTAPLRGLLVLTWVLAGTYTWVHRPTNRFGPLLICVAGAYAVTSLTAFPERPVYAVGRLALALFIVVLAYAALAFPSGRPSGWGRRFIVAAAGAGALVWGGLLVAAREWPDGFALTSCAGSCPTNPFVLLHEERVDEAIVFAARMWQIVVIGGLALIMFWRARNEPRPQRDGTMIVFYAFSLIAAFSVVHALWPAPAHSLEGAVALSALAVPVGLVAGQRRSSVITGTAFAGVLSAANDTETRPRDLERLLQTVLSDPTMTLAIWDRDAAAYQSLAGDTLTLPTGPGRAVWHLTLDGNVVGAVVHDPLVANPAGLAEGLAAVAMVLQRRRGADASVQQELDGAAQEESEQRLRIERDLHDGAMQRVLALRLGLARARRGAENAELVRELARLEDQVASIGDDLRRLAHGIYPRTLVERGLSEALQETMLESGGRLTFAGDPGRLAASVEGAVYFAVLEAIQNATRHAGDWAHVDVSIERVEHWLEFEVVDNGVGFDPASVTVGIGFVSMRQRLRAVRGVLEIESSPGEGTRVVGRVPIREGLAA